MVKGRPKKERPANFSFKRPGLGTPFDDTRLESYVQLRASEAGMRQAAADSNISLGSAQRLEHNEHVRTRLAEIRETAREYTTVKLGAIWQRLWQNALDAAGIQDFKSSNQALGMLLQGMGKDPTRIGAVKVAMGAATLAHRDQFRELLGPTPIDVTTRDTPTADPERLGDADLEGDPSITN